MLDVSKGFGFASAMAWVYSVCIVLVILICYLLFGRKSKAKVQHSYISSEEMGRYKFAKRRKKAD